VQYGAQSDMSGAMLFQESLTLSRSPEQRGDARWSYTRGERLLPVGKATHFGISAEDVLIKGRHERSAEVPERAWRERRR